MGQQCTAIYLLRLISKRLIELAVFNIIPGNVIFQGFINLLATQRFNNPTGQIALVGHKGGVAVGVYFELQAPSMTRSGLYKVGRVINDNFIVGLIEELSQVLKAAIVATYHVPIRDVVAALTHSVGNPGNVNLWVFGRYVSQFHRKAFLLG